MSVYNRATSPAGLCEKSPDSPGVFTARYMGMVPYESAVALQQRLAQERAENRIADVLVLLQHPPVFTTGRSRGENDLLVSSEQLRREGIALVKASRGGGITHHGPGQLLGYPIFNLRAHGLGVGEYIWKLEETVIRTLLSLGINGERVARRPGVWVNGDKICSIGISVSRYVTTHGFALNVNNDLRYFDYINPCGIRGIKMTSIARVLGYSLHCEDILNDLIVAFSGVFGLKCESGIRP